MSEEATSTVVRVVRLLQCVAEMGGEVSVKEFAQRLSLPPSTVHRLLKLAAHLRNMQPEGRAAAAAAGDGANT